MRISRQHNSIHISAANGLRVFTKDFTRGDDRAFTTMDLIVTHTNADFDAFGSAVAVHRLYPEAKILLPGSQEEAVRRFASRALSRQGYEVLEAGTGAEALEVMTEAGGIVDLVVSDIVMPIMNGLEAAKEIRKKCESAKVLMLTQYDDEENVLASRQAGALGFIPKAAASSHLLTGIRSVGRGDESWIESLSRKPYR